MGAFSWHLARCLLISPSTRMPKVVPPQCGAVRWSPVTSDVRWLKANVVEVSGVLMKPISNTAVAKAFEA